MYAIAICDDNEKICHHIEDILIDYAGQKVFLWIRRFFMMGKACLNSSAANMLSISSIWI